MNRRRKGAERGRTSLKPAGRTRRLVFEIIKRAQQRSAGAETGALAAALRGRASVVTLQCPPRFSWRKSVGAGNAIERPSRPRRIPATYTGTDGTGAVQIFGDITEGRRGGRAYCCADAEPAEKDEFPSPVLGAARAAQPLSRPMGGGATRSKWCASQRDDPSGGRERLRRHGWDAAGRADVRLDRRNLGSTSHAFTQQHP